MTESWEEKTERLEREYQARIDRLREELREARDIAGVVAPDGTRRGWFGDPRDVIEQLRFENAALTKRVAELEESHQDRQSWRTRKAIEQGNMEREDLIGTENEKLAKRVAELEARDASRDESKLQLARYWARTARQRQT